MKFERLRISAEVYGIRLRSWFKSMVAGLSAIVTAVGGYVLLNPAQTVAPHSELLSSLPQTGFAQFDGILMIGLGLMLALLSFR